MLEDIIYESSFLTFEVEEENNNDPIQSLSFEGGDFDFTSTGGEVSIVFIS